VNTRPETSKKEHRTANACHIKKTNNTRHNEPTQPTHPPTYRSLELLQARMRGPDGIGTLRNQDKDAALHVGHQMPRRPSRSKGEMHSGTDAELVALEHFLDAVQVNDRVIGMAGDDGPVLQTCHAQEPANWGGGGGEGFG